MLELNGTGAQDYPRPPLVRPCDVMKFAKELERELVPGEKQTAPGTSSLMLLLWHGYQTRHILIVKQNGEASI